MTSAHAFTPDPVRAHGPENLADARRAHLASCAETVRRVHDLFVPTAADRLALITSNGSVSSDMWSRFRRGAFAACDLRTLNDRDRRILMALAVQHAARTPLTFSHSTADAILDLPAIGNATELVEFATAPDIRGRSPQSRRRRTSLAPEHIEVEGLRVTTFDRTVIDRARSASLESAIAAADAALRLGVVEQSALLSQARALPKRSRGCKMAELAMCLSDARAESPLESLSRTRIFQLGLPMPELQVEFFDASGFIGRVDFYWRQLGIVGEADGRMKFHVADGLTGDAAEEAVWRAKRRDDRLRRHPDIRDVGHWDWGEALNPHRFATVMAGLGVRPEPFRPGQNGGWALPDGPLPRKSMHTSVIERYTH
ncbi:hypothetical protein [Flexivirga caeni]|uniref:Uncharacterized protein n=1 Tax=Flexivirga caeni TaxID=2294115 RepID=A0A3M9MBE1_9MICO|nr:hypothetical protein [Flexivirga caeni]RNI22173.1 hypothetical protein EFY87_09340 [Flexivirga caeni]